MDLQVVKTGLNEILSLRALFLDENNFQVRYNACHERGWTDEYMFTSDDVVIGYGSVKGKENHSDRDTIFEYYLLPQFRNRAPFVFSQLIKTSGAAYMECQSNDLLLSGMIYGFGRNVLADVVLFKAGASTNLAGNGAVFRKRKDGDQLFEHKSEPEGDYVIEKDGAIVATGGFLLHYNKPFADLYMEVAPDFRKKGFGSFLIQEIKNACYAAGRVPAARCNLSNKASQATLLKGGMEIVGYMLSADVE